MLHKVTKWCTLCCLQQCNNNFHRERLHSLSRSAKTTKNINIPPRKLNFTSIFIALVLEYEVEPTDSSALWHDNVWHSTSGLMHCAFKNTTVISLHLALLLLYPSNASLYLCHPALKHWRILNQTREIWQHLVFDTSVNTAVVLSLKKQAFCYSFLFVRQTSNHLHSCSLLVHSFTIAVMQW